MEAIILAGGFGTRLQSVLTDIPKPMAPILDKPFLEWQMEYFASQGINHFVLSTHYKAEVIEKHFKHSFKNIPIHYAREENPMGTGGAILYAAQKLRANQTFLVLNGDTFFRFDLKEMFRFHQYNHSKLTIALAHIAENSRYGAVEFDSEKRITSFKEKTNDLKPAWINSGAYLIDASLLKFFEVQKMSFEAEMIPQLFAKNILTYGFESSADFLDIGIPEDYDKAADFLRSHY